MRGECPRANTPGCPYMDRKGGCRSDEHHLYYPAYLYKSPLERAFRELPQNKEQICRDEHDEIHRYEFPPKKPPVKEMLEAMSRIAIEAHHEQAA